MASSNLNDLTICGHFVQGDKVEYWSSSYQQWMSATIERVIPQNKPGDWTYDLDVKKSAQAKNIRPASSKKVGLDRQPAPLAPSLENKEFSVDEKVDYWSETHKQWMKATVMSVHGNGIYDLDVKCKAHARRMRKLEFVAGPDVAAGGAKLAPVRERESQPQAVVHRGPSPLSGRSANGHGRAAGGMPPHRLSTGSAGGCSDIVAPAEIAENYSDAILAARSLPNGGSLGPMAAGGYPHLPAGANIVAVTVSSPTKAGPQLFRQQDRSQQASTAYLPPAQAQPQSQQQPQAQQQQQAHHVQAPQQVRRQVLQQAHRAATPPRRVQVVSRQSVASAAPRLVNGTPPPAGHAPAPSLTAVPSRSARVGAGSSRPSVTQEFGGERREPLEFCTLQLPSDVFNPLKQPLKSQLLQLLGLGPNGSIDAMQGFKGGLNQGIWYAKNASQEFVLKLVRPDRIATNVLTEAENFRKIQETQAGVISDPVLSFPVKIFSCVYQQRKLHDLIVMRRVRGERLAEWIARRRHQSDTQKILHVFELLGATLSDFHRRYGNCQHGDFQPSNVFYDEETNQFCFIDNGGMGVHTTETDVEHFVRALNLLSEDHQGRQFAIDGTFHFESGYSREARS